MWKTRLKAKEKEEESRRLGEMKSRLSTYREIIQSMLWHSHSDEEISSHLHLECGLTKGFSKANIRRFSSIYYYITALFVRERVLVVFQLASYEQISIGYYPPYFRTSHGGRHCCWLCVRTSGSFILEPPLYWYCSRVLFPVAVWYLQKQNMSSLISSVSGCHNNWRERRLFLESECFQHKKRRSEFCGAPFNLFPPPSTKEDLRSWLKALNLKHVCSYHFVDGKPTAEHPIPEKWLGYETQAKARRRVLVRASGITTIILFHFILGLLHIFLFEHSNTVSATPT